MLSQPGSMTKTIPKREPGVEDSKRKGGKAASQEVRGTERRDINEIKNEEDKSIRKDVLQ